jgi:hypothetical protein
MSERIGPRAKPGDVPRQKLRLSIAFAGADDSAASEYVPPFGSARDQGRGRELGGARPVGVYTGDEAAVSMARDKPAAAGRKKDV